MKKIHSLRNALVRVRATSIALAVSVGTIATGSAYAASCQTMLQGHLDWVTATPSGYSRTLGVSMVSNFASNFASNTTPLPEATYLNTTLNKGGWIFSNSLVGTGEALFNNREWTENCNGFFCPSHPFDPAQTDTWSMFLTPSSSSMVLSRGGTTLNIPLDCETNLSSGTYTRYIQFGNFKFPVSKTKYVLSLYRNQIMLPK